MTIERSELRHATSPNLCLDAPVCEAPDDEPDELVCVARAERAAGPETSGLSSAADGFLAAALSVGETMIGEGRARATYGAAARETVERLAAEVELGRLSAGEAADELHRLRATLELQLEASSDTRRAWATLAGSRTGETFAAAERRVARELFGTAAGLSVEQRHAVHVRLGVELAEEGRAASRLGRALSGVGRAFIGVSAAVAIHGIATAEDKARALAREALVFGVGKVGAAVGAATGAAVCGPAAPVCAPVGALAGDVLFSMGAGALFDVVFDEE